MRTIPTTAYDQIVHIHEMVVAGKDELNAPITALQLVCPAWASVSNKAAIERVGRGAVEALTTEVFTIRYCQAHAAIKPMSHFIIWGGRTYKVTAISPLDRNEGFDVVANAEADDGL